MHRMTNFKFVEDKGFTEETLICAKGWGGGKLTYQSCCLMLICQNQPRMVKTLVLKMSAQ
jgi:hypothetical protein